MWIVILFLKTCQGVSFEVAKLHCFELHYHAKMYMYISLQFWVSEKQSLTLFSITGKEQVLTKYVDAEIERKIVMKMVGHLLIL
jgi:hypothetical protein